MNMCEFPRSRSITFTIFLKEFVYKNNNNNNKESLP